MFHFSSALKGQERRKDLGSHVHNPLTGALPLASLALWLLPGYHIVWSVREQLQKQDQFGAQCLGEEVSHLVFHLERHP